MLSSVLYFRLVYYSVALAKDSGGGEIRTHDTVSGIPHFECGAFGHSATPPIYVDLVRIELALPHCHRTFPSGTRFKCAIPQIPYPVDPTGFEPVTSSLQTRRSAN